MNILNRVLIKMRSEKRFLFEHKLGWIAGGGEDIPKFILKKYLPVNPIIVDCGAHAGSDAVEMARIFPKSTIHCFEPVKAIFSTLQHNTRKYSNIHCYKTALSAEDGRASMYISSGGSDGSSSLNKPKDHLKDHPSVHFENIEEVEVRSLDSWASQNGITHVDFLWLDMQGHEFSMLNRSNIILPGVKVIHSEVSLKEAYEHSILYSDYKAWLESKGFVVVREAIQGDADMGNALFVRKELLH